MIDSVLLEIFVINLWCKVVRRFCFYCNILSCCWLFFPFPGWAVRYYVVQVGLTDFPLFDLGNELRVYLFPLIYFINISDFCRWFFISPLFQRIYVFKIFFTYNKLLLAPSITYLFPLHVTARPNVETSSLFLYISVLDMGNVQPSSGWVRSSWCKIYALIRP